MQGGQQGSGRVDRWPPTGLAPMPHVHHICQRTADPVAASLLPSCRCPTSACLLTIDCLLLLGAQSDRYYHCPSHSSLPCCAHPPPTSPHTSPIPPVRPAPPPLAPPHFCPLLRPPPAPFSLPPGSSRPAPPRPPPPVQLLVLHLHQVRAAHDALQRPVPAHHRHVVEALGVHNPACVGRACACAMGLSVTQMSQAAYR